MEPPSVNFTEYVSVTELDKMYEEPTNSNHLHMTAL